MSKPKDPDIELPEDVALRRIGGSRDWEVVSYVDDCVDRILQNSKRIWYSMDYDDCEK
jgi:hypothetical protein